MVSKRYWLSGVLFFVVSGWMVLPQSLDSLSRKKRADATPPPTTSRSFTTQDTRAASGAVTSSKVPASVSKAAKRCTRGPVRRTTSSASRPAEPALPGPAVNPAPAVAPRVSSGGG